MGLTDFYKVSPRRALLLALGAASAALLATALVAQYGFGLYPCELCIFQRYPYAAIVGLSLAGLFPKLPPRLIFQLLCLVILLLLADAGIAAYHAGVEAGLFPAPSACSSSSTPGQTLEEMRLAIMNAQLVPCDQPMLHVLGLSIAAWNMIAALALFTAACFCLRKTS